ncbi:MAG TPA: DnaJ domain-containing protein [Ktedonobacterales bacterium]
MIRPDFYAVLGIAPTASADDIRQAFRLLARQYHPDANPANPEAVERFKIINEAYRVLSTPQLRTAYDQALRLVTPPVMPGAQNGSGGPVGGTPTAQVPVVGMDKAARTFRTAGPAPSFAANPNAAAGGQPPNISQLSSLGRATGGPALSGAGRATAGPALAAQPALALGVIPAQPSIAPPRELTRFYLLTELGAARRSAVLEPLPLDLALVIDRSNSMKGEKLFETKRAVLNLLDRLRTDDLLTLVFFDDRAEVLADGESVEARAGLENALSQLTVRGSTELAAGLQATLERLAARQSRSRVATLVLLTDGQTYGDERRCLELAAHARDMGISITALGLGTDWNRDLLDRLAAISGGSSNFVERPAELQPIFEDVVLRLRATLAASMRLTFAPAPGVRIARATRIAPDIAEAFGQTTGALMAAPPTEAAPVTVELGTLVGRPDIESAVVVWEFLLDPTAFVPASGVYNLGRINATYWTPRSGGGQMERLDYAIALPINATGQQMPIADDVRLALELVTAYRLQAQADALKASGHSGEASTRMSTAALRLQAAGYGELAEQAKQAAQALTGAPDAGIAETLRVKYGTKNLGIFHRLRRRILPH